MDTKGRKVTWDAELVHVRARMQRYLRSRFPGVPPEQLEDAVQAVFVDMLEKPEPFLRALRQGESRWRGLAYTAAWRVVRGELRRHSAWRELGGLAVESGSGGAGQEAWVLLCVDVPRAIADAARACSASHHAPLYNALVDVMVHGHTDTAAAKRHGVPREYVNRARRAAQAHLAA